MKRLLVATILALMFHAGLLALNFEWFFDKTIKLPKAKAVTVTISYRQPSAKPALKKIIEEPVKQEKIKQEKKLKKPEKPKPPLPVPVKAEVKPIEAPTIPVKTAIVSDNTETISYPSKDQKTEISEKAETEGMSDHEVADKHSSRDTDSTGKVVTREAFPLYKTNPPPTYPQIARKRGYQGVVVLSVLVDENGRVKNLKLFTSSGYRILDNTALTTVKNWLFEPGMKGNRKAAMWVMVPIRFELK